MDDAASRELPLYARQVNRLFELVPRQGDGPAGVVNAGDGPPPPGGVERRSSRDRLNRYSPRDIERISGVSHEQIRNFRHGKVADPGMEKMNRIAAAFQVNVAFLFGDYPDPTPFRVGGVLDVLLRSLNSERVEVEPLDVALANAGIVGDRARRHIELDSIRTADGQRLADEMLAFVLTGERRALAEGRPC